MEIIQLSHPYKENEILHEPIVLALGFFDGVHLGHQAVIRAAKQEAVKRGIKLAVMTFNQHPKIVYTKMDEDAMFYLSTNERKAELLDGFGVDLLYLVDYTWDFGAQTPQAFVDRYIVDLHTKLVVAGFDYTYGKKDVANMQTLPKHAAGRFEILEVDQLSLNQHKIASTSIRENIENSHIDAANKELGYLYQTSGTVVHGEKRGGALLGYPTANVETNKKELLPGIGVYIVEFYVSGQWYQGMASVGYNVTFGEHRPVTCEVYILDFDRMIYGEHVSVRWHHYLRGEIKFDGLEGLIKQLDQDLVDTQTYFSEMKDRG